MTQNIESMEENPFWDFSLKFYDQKNVATSCLALQEDVGADVNLLLYCCWVASQGAVVIETAEFVEKHGFIDKVVHRKEIKGEIGKLLSILLKKDSEVDSEDSNETSDNIESITKAAS